MDDSAATSFPFLLSDTSTPFISESWTAPAMDSPGVGIEQARRGEGRELGPEDYGVRSLLSISFAGEQWNVEKDRYGLWVTHPRWSLLGNGPTISAALSDLAREAKEIAEALKLTPVEQMDQDCVAMLAFCKALRF